MAPTMEGDAEGSGFGKAWTQDCAGMETAGRNGCFLSVLAAP